MFLVIWALFHMVSFSLFSKKRLNIIFLHCVCMTVADTGSLWLLTCRNVASVGSFKPPVWTSAVQISSEDFETEIWMVTHVEVKQRLTVWWLVCRPAREVTNRTTNCGWWTSCCFICSQPEWACWCSMCGTICLPFLHRLWKFGSWTRRLKNGAC